MYKEIQVMKSTIVIFVIILYGFNNNLKAESVFIEKLFSKIVIDTNYQDTFILEVARYASEITIDSFKSNQNYQLNDSELVRISDHFGFNKMNDFYTAFNNSAKYMGILTRESKKSPKPPSRLPCFVSYKSEMENWFETRENEEFKMNSQEGIIVPEMLTEIDQLVKIRNKFNDCLITKYGENTFTKGKTY